MEEPVPDLVLADTLWDFADQEAYESRAAFVDAVRSYHAEVHDYAPDIRPEESWRPKAVVLGAPRVVVQFISESPSRDEEDCEVELVSDNGETFTAGELLHKLHNAVVGRLPENHHHWFEGFELSAITGEGVPVYTLRLGS
jgi:hypothetical protein